MPDIGAASRTAGAINHFFPKIISLFENTFRTRRSEPRGWVKRLMKTVTIDDAYAVAQGWYSVPMPFPAPRGTAPRRGGFDEFTWTLYKHDYHTPTLEWHIHDVRDSNAPESIEKRAEELSKRLAIYPELVFQEMLLGTVSTYLDADVDLSNIYGGTGLFSNSHSYNGQSLDNINTGTGATFTGVADDLYAVHLTFDEMVDSEGEPFWLTEGTESSNWTVVVPPELRQVFDAVFTQDMALEGGATASSSNYIKSKYGDKVSVNVFERLSDANDWYVFRSTDNDDLCPFVYGKDPKGPERDEWLVENGSDYAKQTLTEGFRWRERQGYGIGVPQTAIKVSNS